MEKENFNITRKRKTPESNERAAAGGGRTTPPPKAKKQKKPSTTSGLTTAPVFCQSTTPPSKVKKTSGKEAKTRLRASSAEGKDNSGKKNRNGKKTDHKSQPPKPPKKSPLLAARKRKSVEKKPEIDQKPVKIEQKDYASLPPGMKPSDFKRPEGAGTDFVLDLGPPKKSPLKSPALPLKEPRINLSEPHRVKALEVEGGKDFATLPEGTKPTDFAQPTEAGTGFVFDMTLREKKIENKAEKRPSTTHLQQKDRSTTPLRTATASTSQEQKPHASGNMPKKMNVMEMEGGKNMASFPQGSKPEDFAQPTEAGTGFVFDLTPAPAKQEMAPKTVYHAVIPESIVAAPPIPRMPTEAGTGFVLDLTPTPARQEMAPKTAYHAVTPESIVTGPSILQMLADPEKEKDKKDESPKPTTPQNKDNSGKDGKGVSTEFIRI